MKIDVFSQGLLRGPSVEAILSGEDTTDFIQMVDHPGAVNLYDCWVRLIRQHGPAMKSRFDPLEVPHLLPHIYIEEWDAERQQSRMRLMGESLKSQWKENVVGLCTDDHVHGDVNDLWKQSDQVVYFERQAVLLAYSMAYIDRPHCTLIDLALPMDDDSGNKFTLGYIWPSQRQ